MLQECKNNEQVQDIQNQNLKTLDDEQNHSIGIWRILNDEEKNVKIDETYFLSMKFMYTLQIRRNIVNIISVYNKHLSMTSFFSSDE